MSGMVVDWPGRDLPREPAEPTQRASTCDDDAAGRPGIGIPCRARPGRTDLTGCETLSGPGVPSIEHGSGSESDWMTVVPLETLNRWGTSRSRGEYALEFFGIEPCTSWESGFSR
jgi:hypothetical protein